MKAFAFFVILLGHSALAGGFTSSVMAQNFPKNQDILYNPFPKDPSHPFAQEKDYTKPIPSENDYSKPLPSAFEQFKKAQRDIQSMEEIRKERERPLPNHKVGDKIVLPIQGKKVHFIVTKVYWQFDQWIYIFAVETLIET